MQITVELRPCMIKNTKALFHRWGDSRIENGLGEYVCTQTIGIVEYENGIVHSVYPGAIKFTDNKINDYCFDKIGGINNEL